MNQPTETEVIGAVKWVVEFITDHISEDEADDVGRAQEVVRILRAALEQYQKPKTVTVKEAELIIHTVNEPYVPRPYILSNESVNRLKAVLKTLGIEITGETPDDKFNNEKDQ